MTTIISSVYKNLAVAVSAYAQDARADAVQLLGTALVGADSRVTDSGEGFTGTLRFVNYSDATNVSTQDQTDVTVNSLALSTTTEVYTKTARNTVAEEMSIQNLISKQDAISYLGSRFGAVRARNEDSQLLSIIKMVGDHVAGTNALTTLGVVNTFGYTLGSATADLIGTTAATALNNVLDAMSAIANDNEAPFYYLVISPSIYNSIRKLNLIDTATLVENNVTFSTLLSGKIRLVVTRSTTSASLPTGFGASYLVTPGAVHYSNIAQVNPTAVERNEFAGNGSGKVSVFYRWGNIMHPKGYSFTKTAITGFATNADFELSSNWTTIATNVNQTGIFPIYHKA